LKAGASFVTYAYMAHTKRDDDSLDSGFSPLGDSLYEDGSEDEESLDPKEEDEGDLL